MLSSQSAAAAPRQAAQQPARAVVLAESVLRIVRPRCSASSVCVRLASESMAAKWGAVLRQAAGAPA